MKAAPRAATKLGLDPAQLGVGEAAGDHPRADAEAGQGLVQVAGGPLDQAGVDRRGRTRRPAGRRRRSRRSRSPRPWCGCRRRTSTRWIVAAEAGRRRRRHRDQVGDLGQRRRRLPHRLVDLAPQPRELQLDLASRPAARPTPATGRRSGGSRSRSGTRPAEVCGWVRYPSASSSGQLRPHGRRPPVDLGPLGHLLRRHRLGRRQVGVDDQLQDQLLSLGKHARSLGGPPGDPSQTQARLPPSVWEGSPAAPTAGLRLRRS